MRNILRVATHLALGAGVMLILSGTARAEEACVRHHVIASQYGGNDTTVKQTNIVMSYCAPRDVDLHGITASVMDAGRLTADALTLLGAVIAASERPLAEYERNRISAAEPKQRIGAGCPPGPLQPIDCTFTATPVANAVTK